MSELKVSDDALCAIDTIVNDFKTIVLKLADMRAARREEPIINEDDVKAVTRLLGGSSRVLINSPSDLVRALGKLMHEKYSIVEQQT